jgi:hypothetical protein
MHILFTKSKGQSYSQTMCARANNNILKIKNNLKEYLNICNVALYQNAKI